MTHYYTILDSADRVMADGLSLVECRSSLIKSHQLGLLEHEPDISSIYITCDGIETLLPKTEVCLFMQSLIDQCDFMPRDYRDGMAQAKSMEGF